MSPSDRFATSASVPRNALVVGGVVLVHAAGLWALQTALARPPVATVIPAEVIAEFIVPPPPAAPAPVAPPVAAPLPPRPPPLIAPPPPPVPRPMVKKPALRPAPVRAPAPAPALLAIADNRPAPPDTPVVQAAPPAPSAAPALPAPPSPPLPAPVPPAPAAPPAPPAPPRIELPSSSAAYLQNPAPGYPSISRRMGEEGKVLLRVFIGADGLPQRVEISQSSGYDRLDRQAMDAVMRWRFVPGKRNGVPEAMWNLVPINFVLE